MKITPEMLEAAVAKAVELGLFPRHPVDAETYLKHWDGMKACLEVALDAVPSHCRTCGAKLSEKYLDRLGKIVPYCRECGESHE